MEELDLTGYTQDEINHMQRVEQKMALHEEVHWLADQLKGDAKQVVLNMIERIAYLNHQSDALETRAINAEALVEGAVATAQEFQKQRDAVLDEMSEYIKDVQAGTHRDVQKLIQEAYQAAFEEYHLNHGRLVALVEKIKIAEKKGA